MVEQRGKMIQDLERAAPHEEDPHSEVHHFMDFWADLPWWSMLITGAVIVALVYILRNHIPFLHKRK